MPRGVVRLNEILDGCPKNDIIVKNIIIAYSKINSEKYDKILCTLSGGYDSDIVLDICQKCDTDQKIHYVCFDTGLEYQATKEHIKELEKKYGIKIEIRKAKDTIVSACRKHGVPFLSKKVADYIGRLQKYGFQWENGTFEELREKYKRCNVALRWWCNEWGEGRAGAGSDTKTRTKIVQSGRKYLSGQL